MSDHDELLEKVSGVFRDQIQSYKINSQGSGNTVLEINGEWIFRFSKSDLDQRQLEIEKAFLPKFGEISTLPVPKIEYEGQNFIGYRRIEGVPLSGNAYENLSPEDKDGVCSSLGGFLTTLHSTSFQHKNLVEFPLGDADFWKDVWNMVAPLLSEHARQKSLEYFSSHVDEQSPRHMEKVICHGDFHPNHILFDSTSRKITGIIDFGRLSMSDPATDFNLIMRLYGSEALDKVLKHYSRNISENFRDRIAFQKIRRLFSAIYFAENTDQRESIPRYIDRIENVFQ